MLNYPMCESIVIIEHLLSFDMIYFSTKRNNTWWVSRAQLDRVLDQSTSYTTSQTFKLKWGQHQVSTWVHDKKNCSCKGNVTVKQYSKDIQEFRKCFSANVRSGKKHLSKFSFRHSIQGDSPVQMETFGVWLLVATSRGFLLAFVVWEIPWRLL